MYKLKMANIVIHVKQWSRKSARIESPDQESVSIYWRLEVELPTSNSNKRFRVGMQFTYGHLRGTWNIVGYSTT